MAGLAFLITPLLWCGGLVAFVSYLAIVVLAFKRNILLGLGATCIPLVHFASIFVNWREARLWGASLIVGLALIFFSFNLHSETPLISSDGILQARRIPGLSERSDLHDDATISIGNGSSEAYVVVLTEHKTDFDPIPSLDEYARQYRAGMKGKSSSYEESLVDEEFQVNGMRATQHRVSATIDKVKAKYLMTVLESDEHFHVVLAWSLQRRYEEHEKKFRDFVGTIREVATANDTEGTVGQPDQLEKRDNEAPGRVQYEEQAAPDPFPTPRPEPRGESVSLDAIVDAAVARAYREDPSSRLVKIEAAVSKDGMVMTASGGEAQLLFSSESSKKEHEIKYTEEGFKTLERPGSNMRHEVPPPMCLSRDAYKTAMATLLPGGTDTSPLVVLRYYWDSQHERPVWFALSPNGKASRLLDGQSCRVLQELVAGP